MFGRTTLKVPSFFSSYQTLHTNQENSFLTHYLNFQNTNLNQNCSQQHNYFIIFCGCVFLKEDAQREMRRNLYILFNNFIMFIVEKVSRLGKYSNIKKQLLIISSSSNKYIQIPIQIIIGEELIKFWQCDCFILNRLKENLYLLDT
ncbi:unnamed protein product [Paramecium octaurelia]|uniref:Uncharacterized protein n=1 Tax=Paramecium octaurelia TaxID=43137 RepID=A0A8S1YMV1_PAROT|nr:unnamed protein product [Paramecium octaurelia]